MKCRSTFAGLHCDLKSGHKGNHSNAGTAYKPMLNPPTTPTIQAETLARDISALLIALLQGRNAAEGNIHFRIEPRRMPIFSIAVGDAKDPIHA